VAATGDAGAIELRPGTAANFRDYAGRDERPRQMLHPRDAVEARGMGVRPMDWSTSSNVITYGAVVIAALIMATDEALKHAPNLSAKLPGWMHFAPLLLLIVAGVLWSAREAGLLKPAQTETLTPTPLSANQKQLVREITDLRQALRATKDKLAKSDNQRISALEQTREEKKNYDDFKKHVEDQLRDIGDSIDKLIDTAAAEALANQKYEAARKKLEDVQGTHLITPSYVRDLMQAQNYAHQAANEQRQASQILEDARSQLCRTLEDVEPSRRLCKGIIKF
jgi:hypothetical protein